MEKVYEELEEVKTAKEKLEIDYRNKTELLNNLKKVTNEQSAEIREARSLIEKQSFESEEKTREISELKQTNKDLQRRLREKDSVIKQVNEANEKLRAKGEEKFKEFEEERRKLILALDEASEKNIDMEQRNNVYRAEIEGLKGHLAIAEKKKMEVEKAAKALRESRGRDDIMSKIEEEKTQVEEQLKWKKEQFMHLKEAYDKLQNQFEANKKEREEERRTLFDEINSLQTKLDSQIRISEDIQKKLQICNSVLSQEESRRKRLEIEVSEFKAKYEDAFAECRDARTQLEDLASGRDEEVAELRQSLCIKETDFKEMKYENRKLEQENRELLVSLKELQEATIQGSGNSALTKMKNKFRNLENAHKNCSVNLRSKEAEWSSQMEKMEEEINDYKLQLQSKEAAVKEVELELENAHLAMAKTRLQYEEISVMFLVLRESVSEAQSRIENVKDERKEEKSSSLVMEQLETKNVELAKANIEIQEERERVACLLKKIEMLECFEEENLQMKKEVERYKETVDELSKFQSQMKEKMKEADKDYEEKLLQVCDALDNTNSDLVAEREKVKDLRRQIDSFGIVKEKEVEKYKEMLEESEKRRVLLENESKENIRELCSKVDIAYVKLAEEVEKTKSIDQSEENTRKELEEVTKSQLLLQEKLAEVSEALETANSELFDKTSEGYQLEFQLCFWKSIAKRLKTELEENQNLRKRVEASLLEQVGIGEAMTQEIEFLAEESLSRELEDAVFSHITTERKLQNEREALRQKEEETEAQKMMIMELEKEIFSLGEKVERSDESVTCFREEASQLRAELETRQREFKEVTTQMHEKLRASEAEVSSLSLERQNLLCFISELENRLCDELASSKILTEVETETKKMMITELEKEICSLGEKLETSDESVRALEAERNNLLCFIGELENRMSKICDEDMKLMRTLERRTTQHCDDDGIGKENNNNKTDSPRLTMKHEAVEEERSPFRLLNH